MARIKLACVELEHSFDFSIGAFGGDHIDRNCLVPIALSRVRERGFGELPSSHVLVIGDTPRDIACARAGATRVLAVATGRFTVTELASHNPDAVLESFEDTESTLNAIQKLLSL